MIFNVKSWEEVRRERMQWQRWFAWFPVWVNDHQTAWLQVVEWRLANNLGTHLVYRLPGSSQQKEVPNYWYHDAQDY